LARQNLLQPAALEKLFELPSVDSVERKSMLMALCALLWIDCKRPFRVAKLRRSALGWGGKVLTWGGLRSSRNAALETVINVAREQAALSKKVLFLSKSQKVFQLWHVVHRPFSYSFALLAIVHIVVAVLFSSR
jgi:hypothetical protein